MASKNQLRYSLTVFAEAMIETLQEKHKDPLEPFEAYELQLREHLYKNPEEFKESFIQGYHLLNE